MGGVKSARPIILAYTGIQVKGSTGAQGKLHAFPILAKVKVDLRGDEGGKGAGGKGGSLVQHLNGTQRIPFNVLNTSRVFHYAMSGQ